MANLPFCPLRLKTLPRRFAALAGAASLHGLLLAWTLHQTSAGNASAATETAMLRVSLLPAAPQPAAATASTAVHAVVPAPLNMAPSAAMPLAAAAPAAPVPRASSAPADQSAGATAVVYYAAHALTKMPAALMPLDTLLSVKDDDGIGGKLSLRLWIDDKGRPVDVSLLESEIPQAFAEAALSAFRQMRFAPGEIDGMAVRAWVDVVVEYADLRRPSPPL